MSLVTSNDFSTQQPQWANTFTKNVEQKFNEMVQRLKPVVELKIKLIYTEKRAIFIDETGRSFFGRRVTKDSAHFKFEADISGLGFMTDIFKEYALVPATQFFTQNANAYSLDFILTVFSDKTSLTEKFPIEADPVSAP